MKNIGFLSFGHWTPSPQSQAQTAADVLLQSIDLAVEAERLGVVGAYFRVHHFARQLASPFSRRKLNRGACSTSIRAYLSEEHRDHPDSGCPSTALLPEISRQEPATRHVYTESVKRLLDAVEPQLPNMPKGPKAREIAIATMGLLIGTLQMARAVDDSSLSEDILASGTHVASTLIQSSKRRI